MSWCGQRSVDAGEIECGHVSDMKETVSIFTIALLHVDVQSGEHWQLWHCLHLETHDDVTPTAAHANIFALDLMHLYVRKHILRLSAPARARTQCSRTFQRRNTSAFAIILFQPCGHNARRLSGSSDSQVRSYLEHLLPCTIQRETAESV